MQQKTTLKTLQTLHLAMMMAQLIAILAAVLFVWKIGPLHASESLNRIGQIVWIVLGLPMIIIGVKQYQRALLKLRTSQVLPEITAKPFKKSYIIMLAAVEATVLLGLIAFVFSGNSALLVVAVMLLLFFASLHPSKTKKCSFWVTMKAYWRIGNWRCYYFKAILFH